MKNLSSLVSIIFLTKDLVGYKCTCYTAQQTKSFPLSLDMYISFQLIKITLDNVYMVCSIEIEIFNIDLGLTYWSYYEEHTYIHDHGNKVITDNDLSSFEVWYFSVSERFGDEDCFVQKGLHPSESKWPHEI